MSDVPKAGDALTLATGGSITTFEVVVAVVGMALDGELELAWLELAGLELGAVSATVIGGTETTGEDSGAEDTGAAEATDTGVPEPTAFPPDVQPASRISNPDAAATAARRRARNIN